MPSFARAALPALALAAGWALAAPTPPPKPNPNPITAANVARLEVLKRLPHDVWRLAWGPQSRQVSFISWEKPVQVLDADTFRLIRQLAAGREVLHFAFSREGGAWAFAENNSRVVLHPARADKPLVIETNNRQVNMAFCPDGNLLATGGFGRKASLWDAKTGRLVRELPAGTNGALTPVFSPDGKSLAVGNRNDSTRIFEVATGKLLHTLPARMTHEIQFSPDGKSLAAAYVNGEVRLWRVADGKLLHERETGAAEVYTLDWSRKGDVLAVAGHKGKLLLLKTSDLSTLRELEAPDWVIRVRFSPAGDRLLSCGGGDRPGPERAVTVWGLKP